MSRTILTAALLSLGAVATLSGQAACGGEDRWAVKMGADPGAASVDLAHPVPTTLHELIHVTRPAVPNDEVTRTAPERVVRVVEGRLVKFKKETGKTGDADFHLVIADETLLFSPGGPGTTPVAHSTIAEIPDPDCVPGRENTVTTPSLFAATLVDVRAKFMAQFPHIITGWNDAEGVPVRLTGVTFFDRDHNQTGRALNGLELHPLLDIEFNPATAPVAPVPGAVALANPGFEDGNSGWNSTTDVISTNVNEPSHSGGWKAWLGGYGTPHTDKIWQQVALPASAGTISLTFFLHIDTEEPGTTALDKLSIRIRDGNGTLLKTLKVFNNLHATEGFSLQSFDLTAYKGKTIRIELAATEDNGSITSFVVDDFSLIVEAP